MNFSENCYYKLIVNYDKEELLKIEYFRVNSIEIEMEGRKKITHVRGQTYFSFRQKYGFLYLHKLPNNHLHIIASNLNNRQDEKIEFNETRVKRAEIRMIFSEEVKQIIWS